MTVILLVQFALKGTVVLMAGSMNLTTVVDSQAGGFWNWYAFGGGLSSLPRRCCSAAEAGSLTTEYPANGSFFRPQDSASSQRRRQCARSCRMQLTAVSYQPSARAIVLRAGS